MLTPTTDELNKEPLYDISVFTSEPLTSPLRVEENRVLHAHGDL